MGCGVAFLVGLLCLLVFPVLALFLGPVGAAVAAIGLAGLILLYYESIQGEPLDPDPDPAVVERKTAKLAIMLLAVVTPLFILFLSVLRSCGRSGFIAH